MQPAKILVVDDNLVNLKVAGIILHKSGYEVISAVCAHDAIMMAQNQSPDLILLDLMMPGMNGFEICKVLKSDVSTSHIPVIFCTAYGGSINSDEFLKAGAAAVVRKPLDMNLLLSKVQTSLQMANSKSSDNQL